MAQSANQSSTTTSEQRTINLVDWATGPRGVVLKLSLEFQFTSLTLLNNISYLPYGLENDKNYPVFVRSVETSSNGVDWYPIFPEAIWVGTTVNIQAARTAPNIFVGQANWVFEPRNVLYVRIRIEQAQPIESLIGHIYYADVPTAPTAVVPQTSIPLTNEVRVQGPDLEFSKLKYLYSKTAVSGETYIDKDTVARREYFPGKRWAIGIRDITMQQVDFALESIYVSKKIRVGSPVDRVAIDSDVEIPQAFNAYFDWNQYWISPDDGISWYKISRLQDNYLAVPEQLAFNDPIPTEFQETGVQHISTKTPVTELRVKIVLRRPNQALSGSPVVLIIG